jgi:hypothetical protein
MELGKRTIFKVHKDDRTTVKMILEGIISIIIVFMGVILGTFLGIIAPEELKAGKRWLEGLFFSIFFLIVYFLL